MFVSSRKFCLFSVEFRLDMGQGGKLHMHVKLTHPYRPLASSMFAPGVPEVMTDFHSDSDLLATFVICK
jgi:hypothetical protein